LHFVWVENKPTVMSNSIKLLRDQLKHIKEEGRCIGLGQDQHCLHVKIWYNQGGIDYTTKDCEELVNNIFPEDLEHIIPSLWPAQDDQQIKKKQEFNIWYNKVREMYEAQAEPHELMCKFVRRMMGTNQMEIIQDDRKLKQRLLWLERIKQEDWSDSDDPDHHVEMGICQKCKKAKTFDEFVN